MKTTLTACPGRAVAILALCAVASLPFGCRKPRDRALMPIGTLKELTIAEVADFTKAPEPDLTGEMKNFPSPEGLKNYAISRIAPWGKGFLAVSNYLSRGRPRVDWFSASGDLLFSCVLPVEFDPPAKDIVIQAERIFAIDRDLPGFRVFRPANGASPAALFD